MRSSDDLFLLVSSGLIVLSIVAIVAILATARGAYAMPVAHPSAALATTLGVQSSEQTERSI